MQLFRDAPIAPGIYLITNLVNGKRYVGQSVNIRERWYTHRCDLRKGVSGCRRLQMAWKHHGEQAFDFTVLTLVTSLDDLDAWEKWFLDALLPEYNISTLPGTRRGVPQPLEAVLLTASKIRGRPKSEEWKRQMRDRHLGQKRSPEWVANIRASKQNVSAQTRAKQSIAAKRRGISRAATEAAATKSRGVSRPPHVVEAIREGQRRRWERYHAAQAANGEDQSA